MATAELRRLTEFLFLREQQERNSVYKHRGQTLQNPTKGQSGPNTDPIFGLGSRWARPILYIPLPPINCFFENLSQIYS